VKILTAIELNQEEKNLLNYGMNYSTEKPANAYIATLAAETEQAIRLLDAKLQSTYRHIATKKTEANHRPEQPSKHSTKKTEANHQPEQPSKHSTKKLKQIIDPNNQANIRQKN